MTRLLTNLFGAGTSRTRRPARRLKPRMESLETREATSGGIHYVDLNPTTQSVIKKLEKRNTLALSHLSPGNYSVSYSIRSRHDWKVTLSSRSGVHAEFTVDP